MRSRQISQLFLAGTLVCILGGCGTNTYANDVGLNMTIFNDTVKAGEEPKNLHILPLVYYGPETSLAIGGGIFYTFRPGGDSNTNNPSKIRAGAVYTLKNQLLLYISHSIYSKTERFKFDGTYGYYLYSYNYFGMGQEASFDREEIYEVKYPEVETNPMVQVFENTFLGVKYMFNHYKFTELEDDSRLLEEDIIGVNGGTTSLIGWTLEWDGRNNIFSCRKGAYGKFENLYGTSFLQSDYKLSKSVLDLRYYVPVGERNALAFQTVIETTTGISPFYHLALLGGAKIMRGYHKGFYRDNDLAAFQAEYRFHIYRKWGSVLYASVGKVFNQIEKARFDELQFAAGTGIRYLLSPEEKVNLRLDVAYGNQIAVYFSIAEAF